MTLSYILDYPIKFLFIHSKARLFIEIAKKNGIDDEKLSDAEQIYKLHIQSKLGLGFIASYLPWTKAFQARKELFFSLLKMHKSIESMSFEDIRYEPSMKELISLTPVYFLRKFPKLLKVMHKDFKIYRLKGDNLLSLVSYLPLISDAINKDGSLNSSWGKNILHSLLNPFRLVSSALKFMHHLVDAIFELGASPESNSIFRQFFKMISVLAFSPIRLPVILMEASFDVVLKWVDTVFLDPFRFILDALKQLISNHSLEMIYEPSEVFDHVSSQYKVQNANIYTFKSEHYTLKITTKENKMKYKEYRKEYDPKLFSNNVPLDTVELDDLIFNPVDRAPVSDSVLLTL